MSTVEVPVDLLTEVEDILDTAVGSLESEWWNCNGGKYAHDQIRAEQARAVAVRDRLREFLA